MRSKDSNSNGVKIAISLIFVLSVAIFTYLWWHAAFQQPLSKHSEREEIVELARSVGFAEQSKRITIERVESSAIAPQQLLPAAMLPPASAPLVEQLAELIELAESGNPAASCRLVRSVTRCNEEIRQKVFTRAMLERLESAPMANENLMIGLLADTGTDDERLSNYCAGVNVQPISRINSILSKTTPWMSTRQKVVLAMTRSDGQLRRLKASSSYSESGLYVIPQFLADHTMEFLMIGYRAKDLLALEGLIMLHAPGHAVGRQGVGLWDPNPRLFLQYSLLFRGLMGEQALGANTFRLMQASASWMTTDELAEINRAVDAARADWAEVRPGSGSSQFFDSANAVDQTLDECAN